MSTETIRTSLRLRRLIGNYGQTQVTSAGAERIAVRLVRNELVQLRKDNRRREVHVLQGIVWLTGTPACGDVILHRGDRFEFGNQWPFVLQALEDAEFELSR